MGEIGKKPETSEELRERLEAGMEELSYEQNILLAVEIEQVYQLARIAGALEWENERIRQAEIQRLNEQRRRGGN